MAGSAHASRRLITLIAAVAIVGGCLVASGVLYSQAPAPGPATPFPRAADGKPDLSGFWQALSAASYDIEPHSAARDLPAGHGVVEGGEIPYLAAALAKRKANVAERDTADPLSKCYLPGTPRLMYMPFPFQIFQTPRQVGLLFEYVHAVRTIYVDGTPHPPGHIDWWLGDSRGRWDGDTLVVDVVDFNDETWFDRAGNHHSDALHLIERYTPIDRDHLDYEVTVEDAKTFSRPWKMRMVLYRHTEANFQLLDYECHAMGSTD